MAEPQPLTDAQIKQRDELNAQAAAYDAAQLEKSRKDKLAALASATALTKLLGDKKIVDAFDAAINDPVLNFETKARVQSMRASLTYNVDAINTEAASLATPAPAVGATA
jgi:hypothetical protein